MHIIELYEGLSSFDNVLNILKVVSFNDLAFLLEMSYFQALFFQLFQEQSLVIRFIAKGEINSHVFLWIAFLFEFDLNNIFPAPEEASCQRVQDQVISLYSDDVILYYRNRDFVLDIKLATKN